MKKKVAYTILCFSIFLALLYFSIGFYLANTILRIDPTCGLHTGSLPNTWSTEIDHHEYSNLSRSKLRKNFSSSEYHLDEWQNVYFPSYL